LPIPALVARYYFRDKHYDEALRLLKESDNINPYLHYNDFIRTAVYASKQQYDSVSYYAKKAFYNWPRATSYYKNVMFAGAKKKDTVEIQKAFDVYVKYRPSAEAWNQYLLAMYEVKAGADARLVHLLDSAIKTYPADSAVFVNTVNIFSRSGSIGLKNNIIADFAAQGAVAFQKGNYSKAAELYARASTVDPTNYTHFENAGICYYTAKKYDQAIPYFQKASQFPAATTGKSEFFMAMSYIALNKKELACTVLQQAKRKNYPGVDAQIQQNCK
jgi:tetratricopeptide (TPR) repeat protein